MRLSLDYENTSRAWWDNGGEALWAGITDEPGATSVVVDDDLARSWLAEASRIPGWDAGTEYAPHPIVATALADDQVDL